MANFYDEGDPGPSTDPTPINDYGVPDDFHTPDQWWDNILDDSTNYREPGLGDEFNGDDPSIWSTTGEAEEPTISDATPALFTNAAKEYIEDVQSTNRQRALDRLQRINVPDQELGLVFDPITGEIFSPDDSIITWDESVAELEAIAGELRDIDEPIPSFEESVRELRQILGVVEADAEVSEEAVAEVQEIAAELEELVSITQTDVADVAPVVEEILDEITDVEGPWWEDPKKLKAFFGIHWDGFSTDPWAPGFDISNPSWMSTTPSWDRSPRNAENPLPWYLKFESALPPASYQWWTGDFGILATRNRREEREARAEEKAGMVEIDLVEEGVAFDDMETDGIIMSETAIQEFGDIFGGVDQDTMLNEFTSQMFTDEDWDELTATRGDAWDEGLI